MFLKEFVIFIYIQTEKALFHTSAIFRHIFKCKYNISIFFSHICSSTTNCLTVILLELFLIYLVKMTTFLGRLYLKLGNFYSTNQHKTLSANHLDIFYSSLNKVPSLFLSHSVGVIQAGTFNSNNLKMLFKNFVGSVGATIVSKIAYLKKLISSLAHHSKLIFPLSDPSTGITASLHLKRNKVLTYKCKYLALNR